VTYLTVGLVQSFLEDTKMPVMDIDANLDSVAVNLTFGRLAARFDVSGWINTATTPAMVLQLAAMKYTSLLYRRQYSENLELDNNWAVYLDKLWDTLLTQILQGQLDVEGVPETTLTGPIFWPTDDSTSLADTDPENPEATPRFALMGTVF
jgi:hypothetical protein